MNYPEARIKHNIGKILFIALIVFQGSILACSSERKGKVLCTPKDDKLCTSMLSIIPGAVGPGMTTPAGSGPNRSGGSIIHVTTLAASGPGSLREAVEASGPRIVVFDVSGYIELQSPIEVKEPYLTIAGQTAPFPGISLRGAGLQIRTHEILIQHIRIRVGDDPNGPDPGNRDGFTIYPLNESNGAYNIVIDHVSVSWGIDENIGTYETVQDVTFANSIIGEGLWNSIHPEGRHSKGILIGPGTRNFLALGNLLAHNDQRNMLAEGDSSTLFVNNLVYNWHGAGGEGNASEYQDGVIDASIVGNVYIRGLDTRPGKQSIPIQLWSSLLPESRIYVDDNEAIEKSSDSWSVVNNFATDSLKAVDSPNWIQNLTAKKSNVVKNWVLNNAGARRADGEAVDVRIINDVLNGTGRIIDSQDDVGGWPPLANNVRGTGGIPALSIPSNEIQPSGYTKVEEWLHLLAKQVEVPK